MNPTTVAHRPWPGPAFPYVVGETTRMQDVYDVMTRVAEGDANVCIEGESGTGKELIAETLHAVGPRRGGPAPEGDPRADVGRPREPHGQPVARERAAAGELDRAGGRARGGGPRRRRAFSPRGPGHHGDAVPAAATAAPPAGGGEAVRPRNARA